MRLLPAATLAATVLLLLGWLAAQDGAVAGDGDFPVRVEGPDGVFFDGTATGVRATPYGALLGAADQGGFDVQATGSGETLFVTAIAGHANVGAGGWCFAVWDDGWVHPSVGADVQVLMPGQAVRWRYEPDGCPA